MTNLTTIIHTIYLSFGISIFNNIPWQFMLFFLQPYGIKLFCLYKEEECKIIQKKIQYFSHMSDNNKGFGYSFGYWYILHLSHTDGDRGPQYSLWMLSTESCYKNLIKDCSLIDENDKDDKFNLIKKQTITIYDRLGSFYDVWYKKREIEQPSIIPRPNQSIIIDKIMNHQKISKKSVVYLYGKPGSGKSMIGVLLSQKYNCNYCNSLIPWQPGDNIRSLYAEVQPTKEKPLIIALEEIDVQLVKIHNNNIEPHKSLPISIKDKTGWNNLLDSIQRGIYPHLILLLTSNKSSDFINELDSSYLRKGRVDLIFELIEDLE